MTAIDIEIGEFVEKLPLMVPWLNYVISRRIQDIVEDISNQLIKKK